MTHKIGRNDPCPCGSGKKYKQCCLLKNRPKPLGSRRFKATVLSNKKEEKAAQETLVEEQGVDLIARTHAVDEPKP